VWSATSQPSCLQIHTDDSFLTFIKEVGQPATTRTLPAGHPPTDLEAAFKVAAQTGQPVVGPPMSDEEAAQIAAVPAA
jgi:hypothetical protein